jgi:hypothetical protein
MFKKAAVERFDAVFALHDACKSCSDPLALRAVVDANIKDLELPDWEFRTALHVSIDVVILQLISCLFG